jgi:hypothetical protein
MVITPFVAGAFTQMECRVPGPDFTTVVVGAARVICVYWNGCGDCPKAAVTRPRVKNQPRR